MKKVAYRSGQRKKNKKKMKTKQKEPFAKTDKTGVSVWTKKTFQKSFGRRIQI